MRIRKANPYYMYMYMYNGAFCITSGSVIKAYFLSQKCLLVQTVSIDWLLELKLGEAHTLRSADILESLEHPQGGTPKCLLGGSI